MLSTHASLHLSVITLVTWQNWGPRLTHNQKYSIGLKHKMSVNFIIEILIMKTKRGSSNGRSMCLLPTKREANSSESWWLTYKCLPDNSPPTTTNSNTQQTGYFHAWYISEYNILKSLLTPSLYAQDILSSIEGNSPFSKGFISVNIPISRHCAGNSTTSSLDMENICSMDTL